MPGLNGRAHDCLRAKVRFLLSGLLTGAFVNGIREGSERRCCLWSGNNPGRRSADLGLRLNPYGRQQTRGRAGRFGLAEAAGFVDTLTAPHTVLALAYRPHLVAARAQAGEAQGA